MPLALAFPPAFRFGTATAAHQIEGACRNNQWWAWEQAGGHVADGTTSGRACDHWNRVDEDADLAHRLGHNAQRLSLEWSRIEPAEGAFDDAALTHYRHEIEALWARGIAPSVTLHHFTNPLWMERAGGWENPRSIAWVERYARHVAGALAGRVSEWWTINEPMIVAVAGYALGMHPPGAHDVGRAVAVARRLLEAHAAMYAAVHAVDPATPVGIVQHMLSVEALDPERADDRSAAAAEDWFMNGCFLESVARGAALPPLGAGEELPGLRQAWDVIGLNYYTRTRAAAALPPAGLAARARAHEVLEQSDLGWEVYPEGLRANLLRLARYGRPMLVTENGIATGDDRARCRFLVRHLAATHAAIVGGADVRGYFHWTLCDNFEWAEGYRPRFGLVAIDRDTLVRRPRPSAWLYRDIIAAGGLSAELLARYGVAAGAAPGVRPDACPQAEATQRG